MVNLEIGVKAFKTCKLIIAGAGQTLIIYKFLFFLMIFKIIGYTLKTGSEFCFCLIFLKKPQWLTSLHALGQLLYRKYG
jgi:hypothetical protein